MAVDYNVSDASVCLGSETQPPRNQVEYLEVRLCRSSPRVNHRNSVRLALGDGQVTVSHASEERSILLLEPVLIFMIAPVL